MKPEYEAFKKECVERRLENVINAHQVRGDPRMLYGGQCEKFTKWFVEKFSELTPVMGFYGSAEHIWCTEPDGTIVDPTVEQFGYPATYRVFNPLEDMIKIGKCPNCGTDIMGLIADAPQEFCDDDCFQDYQGYLEREVFQRRFG